VRIGVVTTSYPRDAGDPAGSFVAAHVAAMRLLGHDVEVISARSIGSSPLFEGSGAPEELERGGIVEQARAMLEAARFTAEMTTAIFNRIGEWDVIIAHWLPCAAAALAAIQARRAAQPSEPKKKLLAIAHGGDIHTLRRTLLLAPTMKALDAGGARVVFVSDELRAIAKADGAIVQPMGINVERFADIARAPTTPPTIAVIGRLVPIKGVDVAIDAMSHLATDARLVIAGDGPERSALEARAKKGSDPISQRHEHVDAEKGSDPVSQRHEQLDAEMGSDPISFAGVLDPYSRDELLSRSSVVVIPSRVLPNGRSEGTPVVALEALAAGVPVVASDVGGLRELEHVVRVPPDDPRALASAIDRVLASSPSSDELRASVAHLEWSRVAQRLLDVALA
jgi:glycosyltransferase involved in cell wall biosynthesis